MISALTNNWLQDVRILLHSKINLRQTKGSYLPPLWQTLLTEVSLTCHSGNVLTTGTKNLSPEHKKRRDTEPAKAGALVSKTLFTKSTLKCETAQDNPRTLYERRAPEI